MIRFDRLLGAGKNEVGDGGVGVRVDAGTQPKRETNVLYNTLVCLYPVYAVCLRVRAIGKLNIDTSKLEFETVSSTLSSVRLTTTIRI